MQMCLVSFTQLKNYLTQAKNNKNVIYFIHLAKQSHDNLNIKSQFQSVR